MIERSETRRAGGFRGSAGQAWLAGAALAACAGEAVTPLATPVVTVEAPSVATQLDERVFVVDGPGRELWLTREDAAD